MSCRWRDELTLARTLILGVEIAWEATSLMVSRGQHATTHSMMTELGHTSPKSNSPGVSRETNQCQILPSPIRQTMSRHPKLPMFSAVLSSVFHPSPNGPTARTETFARAFNKS